MGGILEASLPHFLYALHRLFLLRREAIDLGTNKLPRALTLKF